MNSSLRPHTRPERTILFLVSSLVRNMPKALATKPAFVLPEFTMHRGYVYRHVTRGREVFTAVRTLGFSAAL